MTLDDVITAIEDAKKNWTDWDWTMEFGADDDGNPIYYDSRPDDEDTSEAADSAREYADEVETAAEEAAEYGDRAIRWLEGKKPNMLVLARAELATACAIEQRFGDCPDWSVPLRKIEQLMAEPIEIPLAASFDAYQAGLCQCDAAIAAYESAWEESLLEEAEKRGLTNVSAVSVGSYDGPEAAACTSNDDDDEDVPPYIRGLWQAAHDGSNWATIEHVCEAEEETE